MRNKILSILLVGLLCLTGCQSGSSSSIKDGTYTASAKGMNGDVKVEVVLSEGKISAVTVLEQNETVGVADPALERLPAEIVESQSVNIDTVSGATMTSNAIINGVKDCIKQAGGTEESFSTAVVKTAGEKVEKTADVVIIGGGGAGMSAAVSASEAGAESVIVIEKAAVLGGNTVLAGGGYNCFDYERESKQELTDAERATIEKLLAVEPKNDVHAELIETVQKEYDEYNASGSTYLFDSTAFHALQTYDGGDYAGNLTLIEKFTELSADMLVYLEENGVQWKDTTRTYLGALWPRSHESSNYKSGLAFIETFENMIATNEYPIEIYYETSATEFMMDNDSVVGVYAVGIDGTEYEFKANSGVMLATGGFAGNKELRKKYDPSLLESLPTSNAASITGDGIIMAEAIGANLVGMEYIQSLPVCDPVTGKTSNNVGASTALFINKEGKRFTNEAGRRDDITAAARAQTDGQFYVVVNEANLMADAEGKNKNGLLISDLVESGSTVKADTIEELAEKLNMDSAVLQETVDNFQKAYDTQNDPEFGRTVFDQYVDLSQGGPYYATLRSPAVHHTMGGVEIDVETHVISTDGSIIKGLYAAGEVTGGIHGTNRLGANAVPDALSFGRLAGQNAATAK